MHGTAMRILIVEDHADSAALLARLLKSSGHEARVALDAAAARDLAAASRFDLVLCDLSLPDADGRDLMRSLHDEHGLRGVALSGQDLDCPPGGGFVAHLLKPVDLPSLLELLKTL
jgi:CheY-like chemotaxis protein